MYARRGATRINLHQIAFASLGCHCLLNQRDHSLSCTRQTGTAIIRTPIRGLAELLDFSQPCPDFQRIWRAACNGTMERWGEFKPLSWICRCKRGTEGRTEDGGQS